MLIINQADGKNPLQPSGDPLWVPGGVTPYIQMIGMIVVFLGVVIGDLVFLWVAQVKSIYKKKQYLLGYKN